MDKTDDKLNTNDEEMDIVDISDDEIYVEVNDDEGDLEMTDLINNEK